MSITPPINNRNATYTVSSSSSNGGRREKHFSHLTNRTSPQYPFRFLNSNATTPISCELGSLQNLKILIFFFKKKKKNQPNYLTSPSLFAISVIVSSVSDVFFFCFHHSNTPISSKFDFSDASLLVLIFSSFGFYLCTIL